MMVRATVVSVLSVVGLLMTPLPAGAANPVPSPLGLTCALEPSAPDAPAHYFCNGKVDSWDDVKLDVDLTLPPGRLAPRPLLVMLHGWGNDKHDWESPTISNSNPDKDHYNNVWFASKGYAVLTYTARGFHGSCGPGLQATDDCADGWTHLADRRFEIRDTKYLAGRLADAGVASPQRIGVTGGSYGGGQSWLLALEGDRVTVVPRAHDPSTYDQAVLKPWKSPTGKLMHLAVAVAKYPWTDLIDSLLPNGRAADGVTVADGNRTRPVGIMKASYVSALFASGLGNGYYCPLPCADRTADLIDWFADVAKGEPYDPAIDPILGTALKQIRTWKSPFYQSGLISADLSARTEVPVLDIQGWTDELFPQVEGTALVNRLKSSGWPAGLAVADVGHPLGQNKAADWAPLNARGTAFLDHYLLGLGSVNFNVSARVTTCGTSAGSPISAGTWANIAAHRVRFSSTSPRATTSLPSDAPAGLQTDPIVAFGSGRSLCELNPSPSPSAASWEFPVPYDFTLLGEPRLRLSASIAGTDAEVNSRLYDVDPSGHLTLVTRGAYRFKGTAGTATTIVTALQGNGWRFLTGHAIRLEVTQNDAPYLRIDNLPSAITYTAVSLVLPTPTPQP